MVCVWSPHFMLWSEDKRQVFPPNNPQQPRFSPANLRELLTIVIPISYIWCVKIVVGLRIILWVSYIHCLCQMPKIDVWLICGSEWLMIYVAAIPKVTCIITGHHWPTQYFFIPSMPTASPVPLLLGPSSTWSKPPFVLMLRHPLHVLSQKPKRRLGNHKTTLQRIIHMCAPGPGLPPLSPPVLYFISSPFSSTVLP